MSGTTTTSPRKEYERNAKISASVRVYRQGLGDCILVRVGRENGDDFKLLIDCGVVLGTPDASLIMTHVVENLVRDTNQRVDAIAVTNEHWDHVSGFVQAKAEFGKLKTDMVWVAWTEDKNDELAVKLRRESDRAAAILAASASALRAAGQAEAAEMLADISLTPFGAAGGTSAALGNVKSMGKVRFCRPSDNPFEIDGANARIYVLGPPHDPRLIRKINPATRTPETSDLLMDGFGALPIGVLAALDSRERAANDQGRHPLWIDATPFDPRFSISTDGDGRPVPLGATRDWKRIGDFFEQHYLAGDSWRRIDSDWLFPARKLALALQSFTNNTSLVLALELGDAGKGNVLLFAADAQIGNWESWQTWECQIAGTKVTGPDLLRRTVFYKVAHHGSHNATPKAHGIEQMSALRTAVIPVDELEAKKQYWGQMPFPGVVNTLLDKRVIVLRTDQTPISSPDNFLVTDDYFEINY
jgi:hypothetical protein